MSDSVQQAKARAVRGELVRRYGDVPSSLRAPLEHVEQSTEAPGTAHDILRFAYELAGHAEPETAARS